MRINIYTPAEDSLTNNEIIRLESISKKYAITKVESGGIRGGGSDIVLIVEVILIWGGLEILKSYGQGFFGTDWFKKAGENFRKEINADLQNIKEYLREVFLDFAQKKKDEKGAISINDSVENFEIHAVINLKIINEEIISNLAEDLLRAKVFLSNLSENIEHNHTVQLYPNRDTNRWDYILIPTVNAFGKYVDQYYSFVDGKFHHLLSKREFCNRFDLGDNEKYKMLISPSEDRNFDDINDI